MMSTAIRSRKIPFPLHSYWRRTLSSTEEDRYIQSSKLPTMHFQPGLFRLPIPKLEDTCARYLTALKPVVQNEEDYANTNSIVEKFKQEGRIGKELQSKLILNDKANPYTSYISQPWFNMYLSDRQSLVLNYNPFIAFKEDPTTTDQAVRAANFVWSAVRFRSSLLDDKLSPQVFHLNPQKSDTNTYRNMMRYVPRSLSCYASALFKAFALDMSQYHRLFNTTRIPVLGGPDDLITYGKDAGHVLVLRNGHMYTIQAVQEDGLPVPSQTICNQLRGILGDVTPPPDSSLGYLTALNRDKWAELREDVSQRNSDQLHVIDSALFVMCLDDSEPTAADTLSHAMLHNYGANRWFDKSISLIVNREAHAAINFEHSWGDGVAVLRLFEELYKDSKPQLVSEEPTLKDVVRLEFDLSPGVKNAVEEAKEEIEERCNTLSVDALQYMKYGKDYLKTLEMSPDAILQLAIQIAYYRQFKEIVPSYESCSTAAFKHGRTETIRPASIDAKLCAEAFEQSHPAGPKELMDLITKATKYHSKLVKEAAMGQGFDRHLFALKSLAINEGLSVSLFEDPNYSYMNDIILSTSTLPSDAVLLGGFAPVSPRGYGVGYGIMENWIGVQVATYPTQNGGDMIDNLQQVFDDMECVFNGNNFKK